MDLRTGHVYRSAEAARAAGVPAADLVDAETGVPYETTRERWPEPTARTQSVRECSRRLWQLAAAVNR